MFPLKAATPLRFAVECYSGSITSFDLSNDDAGGTDLTLTDVGVPLEHRAKAIAGWVSVLLALKAAADFGVDLRNTDASQT
jgi:hypothetical protein